MIPAHLIEAAARHQSAGRRVGLILRHAERYRVADLATHEHVLLTERGHAQARESGVMLAGLAPELEVLHSPVERCAETARGLVLGASSSGSQARVVSAVEDLGSPFVKDRVRAWEIVMKTGPTFIRDWFDGKLPPDVFEPRAQAAVTQLAVVAAQLASSPVITVFVTHDWNIALIREDVLAFAPERAWPGYLDGVVVALDGDELIVELDGRTARRPRA